MIAIELKAENLQVAAAVALLDEAGKFTENMRRFSASNGLPDKTNIALKMSTMLKFFKLNPASSYGGNNVD